MPLFFGNCNFAILFIYFSSLLFIYHCDAVPGNTTRVLAGGFGKCQNSGIMQNKTEYNITTSHCPPVARLRLRGSLQL